MKRVLTAGVLSSQALGRPELHQVALRDDGRSTYELQFVQQPGNDPVLLEAGRELAEAVQHPSPPVL